MVNQIINANDVIGVDVKNNNNEHLGEVEAIMLDKSTGMVAYVVLSHGDFLGIGDKLFALPWTIFSYDHIEDCFKIPLNKEQLKNSPCFDKTNWPNMSSTQWRESIQYHYSNLL